MEISVFHSLQLHLTLHITGKNKCHVHYITNSCRPSNGGGCLKVGAQDRPPQGAFPGHMRAKKSLFCWEFY